MSDQSPGPAPSGPGPASDAAVGARAQIDRLLRQRSPLVVLGALTVGALAAVAAMWGAWFWLFDGLPRVPDPRALWTMNRQPSVTFVDRTGELIGVRGPYYGEAVRLQELPPFVPQAFLAIEDRRFYEHRGVDRQALIRAAAVNLGAGGRTRQGGSTITQQLVKNLFLKPDRTLRRKVQEMILAGRIERQLTKEQILELYLNRIYLGEQAYGVDAASRRYFGKPASRLTAPEAALLAALPKAPTELAPTRNFKGAKERQLVVLQAMVDQTFITPEDRDRFAETPIKVSKPLRAEGELGYAFDMAMDEARRLGGPLPQDLVITLSIDPVLQAEAARIVRSFTLAAGGKKKPLQGALMSVDRDGAIVALVGGTSYAKSKFNRVTQAKRQPGSTFKTFVYAAALENDLTPDDVRYDEPINIRGWSPKNYGEGYRGAVTLRTAFAQSLNTVAAQVAEEIGQDKVVELAKRFGITTPLQPVPAISLGSGEVTLFDMTNAFSVVMREGARIDAHLVDAVRDTRGAMLYQRTPSEPEQIYDQDLAHRLTGMMGRVIQTGTGVRARLPGRDAAGKTGTSSDWRDAWFIGFTADYTTGVWVGYDDYTPMPQIAGSGPPAEIWAEYMTFAQRDLPNTKLAGIEPPPVPTRRQFEIADFYDALSAAFGSVFGDEDDETRAPAAPPIR
ncbi:MAG: PBP1A family penicillin-binding protein [Alphaproteobacteria bacterium]|nr:PBP1A family penicillin-binding protein [Alphaproteobacteria bacterium]